MRMILNCGGREKALFVLRGCYWFGRCFDLQFLVLLTRWIQNERSLGGEQYDVRKVAEGGCVWREGPDCKRETVVGG